MSSPEKTSSSHDEQSRVSRRSRLENPFRGREGCFPSFEEAIQVDVDQSHSICSHSSSMNLSIGARASLNEHLRHVARYGIDASQSAAEDDDVEEHAENQRDDKHLRSPFDDHWDRLLEGNYSPGSSFQNTSSGSERIISTSHEGHEAVEVMTDFSSDYFNSSQVELLRTPERDPCRKLKGVTLRGSYDESDSGGHSLQSAGSLAPFPCPESFSHSSSKEVPVPDTSFAALSAVDASRISALDVSHISGDGSEPMLRKSPDVSFAQDHRYTIDEENQFVFPLLTSPERILHEEISVAPEFGPRKPSRFRNQTIQCTAARPAKALDRPFEKENHHAINMDMMALSPISQRTAARSRTDRSHEERSIEFDQMSAAKFFSNLESSIIHEEGLSVESETHLSQVIYDRTHDSDISTIKDPSSSAKNTTSSSSKSLVLEDRRRYRTVVPSRVFMKDPDDFPEQYDSFSVPVPRRKLTIDLTDRSSRSSPF